MNCVLYARVSTDKQAELSIPAQLQAMRSHAHARGWQVVDEFVEPGASAKTTERPALQRMLARIRDRQKTLDVVLVHKIDRLARNVYDHATIKALLKQHGIQLASVVENVDDTVPGQLVENIMASIAQFYSANLAEEVKKGMRQKVKNGGWPHRPPRGYVSARNADGRGTHVEVHPRQGALVRKAFELYATGEYSLRSLAQTLARDGLVTRTGQPLPQANLQRLLTNPFYVGRIIWNEMEVAGVHKALITEALFVRVGQVIAQRYRYAGIKGLVGGFPLRGIAICGSCRGHMTAERHRRWGYYRCSRQGYDKHRCKASFTNADRAHDDLKRICQQLQITRSSAEAIEQAAARLLSERALTREQRVAALEGENARILEHQENLTRRFAAGEITPEQYQARADDFRLRQIEVEKKMRHPVVPEEQLRERIRKTLQVATSLWDLYKPLDDPRRSELLGVVFQTIVLGPKGIIGFTLESPFDSLRTRNTRVDRQADTLLNSLEAA